MADTQAQKDKMGLEIERIEAEQEAAQKRFHVAGFWSYDGGMLTSFHTLEEAKAEVKNLAADGWYIIEGTILEES